MRLLGIGDNVVDCYADEGMMFPGGNAVNVAVYAQRAGVESAYMGVVGSDPAGHLVIESLQNEGVDVERVRIAPGANAYAIVQVTNGERHFLASDDGVSVFELGEAELAALGDFDIVHTASTGSLSDQVADMARYAKVSYDFSRERDPLYIEKIARHLAFATFSAGDLDVVQTESLLRTTHELGSEIVVATRGAKGSLIFDGKKVWRQEATPVRVVDSLGAGDAYVAGIIVGVLGGKSISEAMMQGAAFAAQVCTTRGAFGHASSLNAIPGAKAYGGQASSPGHMEGADARGVSK